jgi:hypothetical protein
MVHGSCDRCGFRYYTKWDIMSKDELDRYREEMHNEDYINELKTPFTKEELERIKEFDRIW